MPVDTLAPLPLKGNAPKWDWEVIEALYLGGMELKEIMKVPKFKGLTYPYLSKRASEGGWHSKREQARAEGVGEISRPLVHKLLEAAFIHQQWMVDRLQHERRVLDEEIKLKPGFKGAGERLALIRQIDELTRKLTGLDDMKPLNSEQRNLGILIGLQNGGPKPKSITIEFQNGATTNINGDEKPVRDIYAEVAAHKQEYDAIKKEEGLIPPPPGFKQLTPLRIKDEPDTVEEILQAAGYKTIILNEGKDASLVNEKNELIEGEKVTPGPLPIAQPIQPPEDVQAG